jgi:hypothetical protein
MGMSSPVEELGERDPGAEGRADERQTIPEHA